MGVVLSDKLLRAIGAIVVYHAEVEHWIDAMVFYLHTHLPGARQFSKKIPTNLAAEVEFLRDCFLKLPAMKPVRTQGLRLLARIESVSEHRHHIIHGYLRHWAKESKTLAFTRMWKPRGRDAEIVVYSIREAGLIATAKRVSTLRHTGRKFAQRVGKICVPENQRMEALARLGG